MTRPITLPTRPLSLRLWLRGGDEYGLALLLILATIVTLATAGDSGAGQFAGIVLGGGTLLFVLRTSGARRATVRGATILVALSLILGAAAILSGSTQVLSLIHI